MSNELDNGSQLTDLEVNAIEHFVKLAKIIGLPKSLGEIYGLLYMADAPMTMDQIISRLNISLGSASQGLKQLKAFKAVKSPYMPGERKEYYVAELELRKLVAGFVKEEVLPFMEGSNSQLKNVMSLVDEGSVEYTDLQKTRLDNLQRWQGKGQTFLRNAIKLINL